MTEARQTQTRQRSSASRAEAIGEERAHQVARPADHAIGPPLPRLCLPCFRHEDKGSRRWRGPGVVPVEAIIGTASALPGTRRSDFLPASRHQPADWRNRWSRLEDAARNLTPLPPIEVIEAGDGYWVIDGHNRVALARATGQLWIDADITAVVLPSAGTPIPSVQRGTT